MKQKDAQLTLVELEGHFLKIVDDGKLWKNDVPMAEADGVMFLCPTCYRKNGGDIGTHVVVCWRPHVPLTQSPGPGRWEFLGSGVENLTLKAGSSSVHLKGGCEAHFYVRDGKIDLL